MAIDKYRRSAASPESPATSIFTILPDDAADLPFVTIALNVATPGHLRVTMADGSEGTIFVTAGTLLALRVQKIWATGTSAGGISGLC